MSLFRLTDADRALVLAAFERANAQRKGTAACYLAAVEVLRQRHPGIPRGLIANEAVRVLTSDVKLVDVARRQSQDSGGPRVPRDRLG